MKYIEKYKIFENNYIPKFNIWYIMKQRVKYNYPSVVREILKYFDKSIINIEIDNKKLIDELISKIPTNISIYKYIISIKINDIIDNKVTYSNEPTDIEVYNKIKNSTNNIDKLIKSNKIRLSSINDKNFLKLIFTYKDYIFNDNTLNEIITLMYKINKNAYKAEDMVKNYFNTNMYEGEFYKSVDSSKEDDIKYGVDKVLVDKYDNIKHRIQVKKANSVQLSKHNYNNKFEHEYDALFINNSNLDINEIMNNKNKWDILSIVSNNNIYIIKKKDIKNIKNIKYNNFIINYYRGKIIIDKLSE